MVDKIVFVGKANACDCTKGKIESSWTALKEVLDDGDPLPITQLQIDKDGDEVLVYRDQKPLMAIPGIYLLSGESKVLDLLQGEVNAQQIRAALARYRGSDKTTRSMK